MKTIIVPGTAGMYRGQVLDYPPHGMVRVVRVNLPGNMVEVEIIE